MANIPKTGQLTSKKSRLINNTTGKKYEKCIFDFGVNYPFKRWTHEQCFSEVEDILCPAVKLMDWNIFAYSGFFHEGEGVDLI